MAKKTGDKWPLTFNIEHLFCIFDSNLVSVSCNAPLVNNLFHAFIFLYYYYLQIRFADITKSGLFRLCHS